MRDEKSWAVWADQQAQSKQLKASSAHPLHGIWKGAPGLSFLKHIKVIEDLFISSKLT